MLIIIVTKGHFIAWLFVELPKFRPSHARLGENGYGNKLQINYLGRLNDVNFDCPIVGR